MAETKNKSKTIIWLLSGTVLAFIPAYIIRFKQSIYMAVYESLTTYPGDLWNFFTNYLGKGFRFPPEYPAGLRFFYEIMGFDGYESYTAFFTVNVLILAAFAIGTTYIIFLILRDRQSAKGEEPDFSRIWYLWVLAPSFIFYSTVNYDLPVIFLIVLSVYLYLKDKLYWATFWLALGMVVKIFPVFLLPVFIWRAPARYRAKMIALFAAVVIALNAPYAIMDLNSWLFPYTWQIYSNLTTGPDQGTYWWIIYPLTGKFTGWLSLALFGSLYLWFLTKMNRMPFIDLCLAIIIIFLLTDRIYSPQYNLYLLPFLALASYVVNRKLFYTAEIANLLILLFCFFLKDNPAYLQTLTFIRYIALAWLLIIHVRSSSRCTSDTYASYKGRQPVESSPVV